MGKMSHIFDKIMDSYVLCKNCTLWQYDKNNEKVCKRLSISGPKKWDNDTYGKKCSRLKGCTCGLPHNSSQARIMAYYKLINQ